ncbi:pseudouridine synthase [Natranaerofaba carboxydovora]|uniref:pseudouridine synthase n=1 Tax=Natranaerofaba carboxydovora TaxID=2742683 RepID=UPI001F13FDD6|nr:pseudouridine synthase [Natranaerofaba carboxydovora]UMZ73897.1 Ribosomal large subunit pseudouridine synthase B [Natranaerofaba carboxydovora]
MRLQKFIAHAGVASRRKAEELITSKRVKVNNEIITELGTKINPDTDRVYVDGDEIKIEFENVYYILNKPKGYVTTVKDEKNRPTVLELVDTDKRIYPVGRLDLNSRGLLMLTNDGKLAHRLTHPRYKVNKTYKVMVKGKIPQSVVNTLSDGIMLEDGFAKPLKVELLTVKNDETLIEMVLGEGRKRQVRRMFKEVGYPVVDLVRTRLGNLYLKGLPEGKFRQLTKNELNKLKKLINLK